VKFRTALTIALAVVLPLSIVQWYWLESSAGRFVFYALFPGNVVKLLITGGHGGTKLEDTVAPYLGALTNIAAYSIFILGCARIAKAAKVA
jgi:hypothetical protein